MSGDGLSRPSRSLSSFATCFTKRLGTSAGALPTANHSLSGTLPIALKTTIQNVVTARLQWLRINPNSIVVTTPAPYALLRYALALVFIPYVLLQARKPDKWFGRIFARAMNRGHDSMTDWGLGHVTIESRFTILDVGCGGGRTIEKLAANAADGMIYGIDYADGSVAVSRELNANLIKAGRVVVQKASVSRLPFPDHTFDLATAIETQYYWPDLAGDMREILRVLKPAGRLVIIAEMYRGGKYDWLKWPVMWLLRSSHLSVSEHRELFASAGYVNIEIFEERRRGWICATATKPPQKS